MVLRFGTVVKKVCLSVILLSWSLLAFAKPDSMSSYNMTQGVTPISHDVYGLHMTIFYICCVIGALVFGVLIYSLVKFRRSKGAKPANFHSNLFVEILWVTVPFIILVVMAIPATKVLLHMEDVQTSDRHIKVIGHQWYWEYEYLDDGIKFNSKPETPQAQIENLEEKDPDYMMKVDNELVLPINQKIRFLVTSEDTIHSWWVPDFSIKRDAIPGFIRDAWAVIEKPGTYVGQCTELCGMRHGYMPIVVKAVTEEEFELWLKEKRAKLKEKRA